MEKFLQQLGEVQKLAIKRAEQLNKYGGDFNGLYYDEGKLIVVFEDRDRDTESQEFSAEELNMTDSEWEEHLLKLKIEKDKELKILNDKEKEKLKRQREILYMNLKKEFEVK